MASPRPRVLQALLAASICASVSNSAAEDVYRLGGNLGIDRTGLFLLYRPERVDQTPSDWAVRVGPDANFRTHRVGSRGQLLVPHASSPTGTGEGLWYYGSFLEGEYRWSSQLRSLVRAEYAWAPTIDDLDGALLRQQLWQVKGGAQYLLLENLALVAEATYGENPSGFGDFNDEGWSVSLRFLTAFWPGDRGN